MYTYMYINYNTSVLILFFKFDSVNPMVISNSQCASLQAHWYIYTNTLLYIL